MPSQLVAYSGFSATNYGQESYSADLDFGTGEFSVGGWVNAPTALLLSSFPFGTQLIPDSTTGWTVSGTANVVLSGSEVVATADGSSAKPGYYYTIATVIGQTYYLTGTLRSPTTNTMFLAAASTASVASISVQVGSFSATATTVALNFVATTTTTYIFVVGSTSTSGNQYASSGVSVKSVGVTAIADRSAASGPSIKLGMDINNKLVATAFDGTTTRTVTTSAAYNTGIFTKAAAHYTVDGKLAINVNGVEVASATGTPLLTMSNTAAVLTIGNSRTLDAPFPGSITMLKLGATVPTTEQAVWMYEQEKQMFRSGAQVTLPDSTAVLDLGYDEAQDKWVAVQAGYESSFTGLIRTASAVVSAGALSKVVVGSGIKALARTTSSPGVDIQIPAYGLREELVKRAEAAAKQSKTLTVFDFDAIAAQTDFVLPVGFKTTKVLSAGNAQREGATKQFTRLFDGFKETIRFAVAPGAAVWVQLNAIKE